jgi:hypothetical protein
MSFEKEIISFLKINSISGKFLTIYSSKMSFDAGLLNTRKTTSYFVQLLFKKACETINNPLITSTIQTRVSNKKDYLILEINSISKNLT